MKARDDKQLRAVINSYQSRLQVRDTVMNVIAGLGLIGFGIMLVPILGAHHGTQNVASVQKAEVVPPNAFASVALQGQAAIVYDLFTGQVIYEKNSKAQLPLASLTKLLTLYAAETTLPTNATIAITSQAISQEGDSGLTKGETFHLTELGRLALVASSNDAAEAIVEAASSAKDTGNANLLAGAAAAAGLSDTYATNGTGLDVNTVRSGGYGSAEDVAKLAGALLKLAPQVAHATIEPSVTVRSIEGTVHTLPNTNQDIVHTPNPLLSKTGFTDLAGGNLVVVFDAAMNHPVAVVVLGSTREGRFSDVDQLVSRTLHYFAGTAP